MSHIPPEWAPHKAIWTAWPSAADLWGEDLEPARLEVAAMIRALDAGEGDRMRVLANGREAEASAKLALAGAAEIIPARFGDIWLRDTGPIFDGRGGARGFHFNGWGGKYVLPHDPEVAIAVAEAAQVELERFAFILEGGAIEMDGEGTLITTRQCLLEPEPKRRLGRGDRRGAPHSGPGRWENPLARRRPDERSHRWPHRQSRPLRGSGAGGRAESRTVRTIPTLTCWTKSR